MSIMKNIFLTIRSWHDYELLDSGDNRKLERFGKFSLIRPETQALWRPARPAAEWARADAEFRFADGKGAWRGKAAKVPVSWEMQWNYKNSQARFIVRPTAFKHVGVFPEQAANWEWIAERVMRFGGTAAKMGQGARRAGLPRILNLFGYTGIASIVAAKAGAQVTHVDASKQSNEWAKENAALSKILAEPGKDGGSIRYILDDVLKFAEREARRGAIYDGIILDPPAFGRGAKGEVWHIEENLPRLLETLVKVFSKEDDAFFLLNGYAAGYSPQSFRQAIANVFPEVEKLPTAEFGELQIQESDGSGRNRESGRVIPSGIYVRFAR